MHTTVKGQIGVAKAIADLLARGLDVFVPVLASSPYDLLVKSSNDQYIKVEVKYRNLPVNGVIKFHPVRMALGRKRYYTYRINTVPDVVCIYCPQTDACYYVENQASISLRFKPTKNNQLQHIKQASDYREFPR